MSDKDYYEILGIRPNAGRDEIELASKGRRSQYHPDRYAQSDAETQAWATSKMQEVNEAYQTLASPEARASHDRCKPSASSGAPPKQKPDDAVSEPKNAAAVLLKPEWKWFHEKVYARPSIPQKKLEGAISAYAPGVRPGDVIVLLDDTLFGGAKEGLLVTSDAIYCKQKFESPRHMAFKAIKRVEPGTDSRILINGAEFFKADLINHLAVANFAARLSEVFEQATADPVQRCPGASAESEANGVARFWKLHCAAMTVLRMQREGRTFLVDELIDRQMQCIADWYSTLRGAVDRQRRTRHTHASIEGECAELALMLFLILHYYGFSKLPSAFKEEAGDRFTRLHEFSEDYKAAFREGFPLVFGRPIEMGEKDLLMMSAVFLNRDGDGEFELKVPREEVLLSLLFRMDIPRDAAKNLIREFEDHAEAWLEELSARVAG